MARAQERYLGLLARHRARQGEQASALAVTRAGTVWRDTVQPHGHQLGNQLDRLGQEASRLEAAQQARTEFLTDHPEVTARITAIDRAITQQQHQTRTAPRPVFEWQTPPPQPAVRNDAYLEHIHHQHIAAAHQAPQIGPAL